jgi:hypothetical protein
MSLHYTEYDMCYLLSRKGLSFRNTHVDLMFLVGFFSRIHKPVNSFFQLSYTTSDIIFNLLKAKVDENKSLDIQSSSPELGQIRKETILSLGQELWKREHGVLL